MGWGENHSQWLILMEWPRGCERFCEKQVSNTATMKADDMTVLSFHDDFLNENTIVEPYLKGRGHKVPKFHCELNPIE